MPRSPTIDDMFIINSVPSDRFFKKGLPCDIGGLSVVTNRGLFGCCLYRAIDLIKECFNKKEVISQNRNKWYSMEYPRLSLHNLLQFRQTKFTGFINHHQPQGYLKTIYNDVWSHCEEDIHRTCNNRLRTYGDVCHWLVRYWQLVSGNFTPYNVFKDGKVFYLSDKNIAESVECILHQKKRVICLNDGDHVTHFEDNKKMLLEAFEQILPDKCGFEL